MGQANEKRHMPKRFSKEYLSRSTLLGRTDRQIDEITM